MAGLGATLPRKEPKVEEKEQRLALASMCGKVLAMLGFKKFSTKEIIDLVRKTLKSLEVPYEAD